MTETRTSFPVLAGPRRGAATGLALAGLALALVLVALPFRAPHPTWAAIGTLAVTGAVVLDRVSAFHPHGRFGVANLLTMLRAAGAAGFVALALEPGVAAAHAWAACGAVAVLLAVDGIDGWVARRQGLASAFGARFDMEVDALLILTLACLAWGLDKAGPWVIALGLMRYGFVLAGLAWPRLARPLPASARRRAVCMLQVAALGLLLAPPVLPPASDLVALAALAALAASFAADIRWLLRQAP